MIPRKQFNIISNISSGLLLVLSDLIEVPLNSLMAIVQNELITLIALNLFGHLVEKVFKVNTP